MLVINIQLRWAVVSAKTYHPCCMVTKAIQATRNRSINNNKRRSVIHLPVLKSASPVHSVVCDRRAPAELRRVCCLRIPGCCRYSMIVQFCRMYEDEVGRNYYIFSYGWGCRLPRYWTGPSCDSPNRFRYQRFSTQRCWCSKVTSKRYSHFNKKKRCWMK